jgi:hypothetical protein
MSKSKTSDSSEESGSEIISKAGDPVLARLLDSMEPSVAESFTEEQLSALRRVVQVRGWHGHSVDFRPTLIFPVLPWSFYMVLLFGRNRRALSSSEQFVAGIMFLVLLSLMGLTAIGFVFIVLYLIKSALGIDLFADESLGIWEEFKRLFDD